MAERVQAESWQFEDYGRAHRHAYHAWNASTEMGGRCRFCLRLCGLSLAEDLSGGGPAAVALFRDSGMWADKWGR